MWEGLKKELLISIGHWAAVAHGWAGSGIQKPLTNQKRDDSTVRLTDRTTVLHSSLIATKRKETLLVNYFYVFRIAEKSNN